MRRISIALLLLFLVRSSAVRGDFLQNVEHFEGTTYDASTWISTGGSSVVIGGGYADFFADQHSLTSRTITVGVGDVITARAMLTAPSQWGTSFGLGLCALPGNPFDSPRIYGSVSHTIQGDSYFDLPAGTNNGSTGHPVTMANNVGQWYRIELKRTSLTNFDARVLTDSGTQLYTRSRQFTFLPERAHIFISGGKTARFDWVAIPEPGVGLIAAFLPVCLLRNRPRGVISRTRAS